MPIFEYQGENAEGVSVRGTVLGQNLDQALAGLTNQGMKIAEIKASQLIGDPLATPGGFGERQIEPPLAPAYAAAPSPGFEDLQPRSYMRTHVVGPIAGRVPLATLGFFFRQLGTMLKAGVPYVQSLDTLMGQARDPRMHEIVSDLRSVVREGRPISEGLQRYPETITPVMISILRAGEIGGFLDASLYQIADYIDREIELRNMYKRATLYPKLVLVSSFLIVGATNSIIASLGKEGGLSSPLSTNTWMVIGVLCVGIWLFLRVGLANARIKYNWDSACLRIPVLGTTLHQLAMAKFGRAFGALYKGGVPITKAMPLSADACGNEYLRARIHPALRRMEEGDTILGTLKSTGAFSPIVLDMIGTGETTGNMELMVTKIAEYYEQEAANRQNALAAFTGVFLVLLSGIYVGYMVITFYTGHYSDLSHAAD